MKQNSIRLLGILLVGFLARVIDLNARPIWYDEAFSVLLAERGPAAIIPGTAADTMPPGYYILLNVWMSLVGQSAFAGRMLSVALGFLVIVFVFVIAKRGFGEGAARWAALFVALNPFQLYHAQEMRMYTLLALGTMIYLYGVLCLEQARGARISLRVIVLLALGTAIALYAHNLAFVSLLAGNVYFLFRRLWRKEAQLILAQVGGAVLFSPWLLYVPTQLEKIQRAFWTQTPGVLEVVQMLVVWIAYLPLPPLLVIFALFLSIFVLVLTVWNLVKLARQRRIPTLGLFVIFILVPPVLLFVISFLIRPVFVPRAAVGSALVFAILVGVVVAQAGIVMQRIVLGVTLLVAVVILPFYYSAYGEWRRAPFAEADGFLAEQWKPGDVILHDNKLSFFSMHLYNRELPQFFLADPPQSDNDTLAPASQVAMDVFPSDFDETVNGHSRVWFVIFQTAIDEAGGTHANLGRLDAQYQRAQETSYGDIRIFLYASR